MPALALPPPHTWAWWFSAEPWKEGVFLENMEGKGAVRLGLVVPMLSSQFTLAVSIPVQPEVP